MTTGWPPGLLQDDCRKLSKWFASRPEARYLVRRNLMTDCTPARARELADTPLHKSIEPLRNAVRSLANQVEALTAERDAPELVAGAHPAKGTSALAAPVVPAPVARAQNFTTPDDDLNVLLQETYAIGNCTNCSHDEASLWLDALQKVLAKINAQAAPVAQLSEPPEGWKLVLVNSEFDDLMIALARAQDKGYMPDAMLDEWMAFEYRAAPTTPKD